MELDFNQLLSLDNIPGAVEGEEVVVYEKLELVPVESHPADRKSDLETDYAQARKTVHYMNQMLMNMAEIALHNAKNSESPKHVEAFTALMGQLNQANAGFMKIHKEMREITEEKTNTSTKPTGEGGNMNIENATVFVGSPTELMQKVGSAYEPKQNEYIDGEIVEVENGNGTNTGSE